MTRLSVLLLIALAIGGCGRRGALEPPPDPTLRSGQPSAGAEGEAPPRRRFILDPLI